jgi:ectoine hydroxylase-related dioxygenase (phytanoyl-CoA dioxygenase family)
MYVQDTSVPLMSETAERHPWNRGFTWRDRAGPFGELSAGQVAAFDRDGFLVVPDLVEPDVVERARDEIDRFEAEADAFLRGREGGRVAIAETGAITFTVHLVARSTLLRELSRHPRIVGLCADLIGPDVNLYWDQAVYKKPEKPRRFPWHQDNGYAFVEPQQYLTVWLALTDATTENGCPWVAPGRHRTGTLRHVYVDPLGYECLSDVPDAVPAEVPAGGAVVFSSLTPHLTGPNATDHVRKAYILQYAPAGATVLRGDADAGPPERREPADAPDRQYPVLRDGRPC